MKKKIFNDVHHLIGVKKEIKIVPGTVVSVDSKYYSIPTTSGSKSCNCFPSKLKWFRNSKVIFWAPIDNSSDYCFIGYDKGCQNAEVYKVDYMAKGVFSLLSRIECIMRYKYHYNTYRFCISALSFYKFRSWATSHNREDLISQFNKAKICICNLNGGDFCEAIRYVKDWECGLAYCDSVK